MLETMMHTQEKELTANDVKQSNLALLQSVNA